MNKVEECQILLKDLAEKQGYLTFDNILEISDTFELSVSEVDRLSESLQLMGIITYEEAPVNNSPDELDDYSRVDYELIFSEVINLDDSMRYVVDEIKKYNPPQHGEATILIKQIRDGNKFARERLITIYLRTALKVALSMTKQYSLDISDAFSAGVAGLIVAIDKYDPNGFSSFHSYASLWIQQNIQRNCNPTWMEFYYPVHAKDAILKILSSYERISNERLNEGINEKYVDIVANDLGIDNDQLRFMLLVAYSQQYGKDSIEAIIDEENDEFSQNKIIYEGISPYEYAERSEMIKVVDLVIKTLKDREQEVVYLRNGFFDGKCFTLEEIGKKSNVTRERIRQIEAKAYRKLKRPTIEKTLHDFLY